MTPWSTSIVKAQTAEGHFILTAAAPWQVGQTIDVDIDSRRVEEYFSRTKQQTFKTEVIDLVEPLPNGQKIYFPVELLDL